MWNKYIRDQNALSSAYSLYSFHKYVVVVKDIVQVMSKLCVSIWNYIYEWIGVTTLKSNPRWIRKGATSFSYKAVRQSWMIVLQAKMLTFILVQTLRTRRVPQPVFGNTCFYPCVIYLWSANYYSCLLTVSFFRWLLIILQHLDFNDNICNEPYLGRGTDLNRKVTIFDVIFLHYVDFKNKIESNRAIWLTI